MAPHKQGFSRRRDPHPNGTVKPVAVEFPAQPLKCFGDLPVRALPLIYLPDGSAIRRSVKWEGGEEWTSAANRRMKHEFAGGKLDDGRFVDLVESSENPCLVRFVVLENGELSFCDQLAASSGILIPPPRDHWLLKYVRLPRGTRAYSNPEECAQGLASYFRRAAPIDESPALVLAACAQHTWVADLESFSVTIILVGPPDVTDPVLEALAAVCRRALILEDATAEGIFEACSSFGVTPLVTERALSRSAARLLGMSVRRNRLVLRKGRALPLFGPRVLVSSEFPDLPVAGSSALVLTLVPVNRPKAMTISKTELEQSAESFRQALLAFRLDRSRSPENQRPEFMGLANPGKKRILSALLAPFPAGSSFAAAVASSVRDLHPMLSDVVPVTHRAGNSAVFFFAHQHADCVSMKELCARANRILEGSGEDIRVSPKKMGAILTAYGFPDRERTETGYALEVSQWVKELTHRLAKRYGWLEPDVYGGGNPDVRCELCRDFELVSPGEIRRYEHDVKPIIEQRKREEEQRAIARREEAKKSRPPRFVRDQRDSQK